MRLIEQITSLRLQIISLISLFVSTVLFQIADYQISEYNGSIITKMQEISHIHEIRTDHKLNANFYTLYQSLTIEDVSIDEEVFTSPFVDQESKDLFAELQNGSLSFKDFIKKKIAYNKRKSKELLNEYNLKITELNEYIEKGTWWKPIKNFILIPVQGVVICMLAIGYFHLLGEISRRTPRQS